MAIEQVAFVEILTFIGGALLFIGMGSFVGGWLGPQHPKEAKLRTYESGEEPAGSAWARFNTGFYVIGLVFVLFEVETVLLFPWATVWANGALNEATGGLWADYTALSGVLFITLLAVGLAYVWRQGHLAGIRPPLPTASFLSKIPKAHYEQVNSRYASGVHKAKDYSNNSTPSL